MDSSALTGFTTQITGGLADFSINNLGTILLAGIGVASGLVICWFAYKFIVRKVTGALNKGRLK